MALVALTGLGQALYMQPDECVEALSELKASGDHQLLTTLLDRIEELAVRTAKLGLVVKPDEYGSGAIDYEEQLAQLKPRIEAVRAALR